MMKFSYLEEQTPPPKKNKINKTKKNPRNAEDCIKRAQLRLGQEKYSLACNNEKRYSNCMFSNNNLFQKADIN